MHWNVKRSLTYFGAGVERESTERLSKSFLVAGPPVTTSLAPLPGPLDVELEKGGKSSPRRTHTT